MIVLKADVKTNYHRAIVTPQWLRSLAVFAFEQIHRTGQYRTGRGRGNVFPEFNEERHTGPMSLVKNNYRMSINVARGLLDWRIDKFDARVCHIPETNEFKLVSSSIVTVESLRRDKHNHQIVDRIVLAIANGCDQKLVEQFKCPWCDADVTLNYHPTGRAFALGCANTRTHFGRHSKSNRLPDWWHDAVSDGWLDESAYEEAM